MRYSFSAILLTLRLALVRLQNPLLVSIYRAKFFPPPQKAVSKQGLTRFFFPN